MIAPTAWDHRTLPYSPAAPCQYLFYLVPGDEVPRVSLPNSRGEFHDLFPGLPYLERRRETAAGADAVRPVLLQEFQPPPLWRAAETSTEQWLKWERDGEA